MTATQAPHHHFVPPAGMLPEHHVLSGWGESVQGWARVWRPRDTAGTAALLARFAEAERPVALRGAGRSYGDAAFLDGGDVIDLSRLRRIRSFDAARGVAEVEAGVTIEDLWRAFLPRGWWPAVVPGTMRPTVAGCVAMNVHGKNHWKAGGFTEHVEELELAQTTGGVRHVRAEADSDLFRAVAGGMGLLAAVTAARIRLHRVASGRLNVHARAVRSLPAMIEHFEAMAPHVDYLVGWVDAFDPKGRGVLHAATNYADGQDPEAAATLAPERQELPPRILGVVPRGLAPLAMSPLARPSGIRALNAAKYRAAVLRGAHDFPQEHVRFAFLLDYIPGWKRLYAPGGLLQYQTFVPRLHAAETHLRLLEACRNRRMVPWLAVYKKHRNCRTLLAHAVDGYSLALDFPVPADDRRGLVALCREMDEIVLDAGGRLYFAKDQTTTPETVRRTVDGLGAFREWKRRLDPSGVLTSALARRLELFGS